MGKNDSTKTRVTPVFRNLFNRDPSGNDWLTTLLALPGRNGATADRAVTLPVLAQPMGFGADEISLEPPIALLQWMIEHPDRLSKPKRADEQAEATRAKRKALLKSDPAGQSEVQAEALRLLSQGAPSQVWYVLEGRSRPDVYFETSDTIIVIEGKRTEPKETTATSWLKGRHQMLRHLDCAWERRGNKRLLGFFVVEAKKSDVTVPKTWRQACDATVAADVLAESLPHRSPDEQQAIADAFIGATTWQAVSKALGVALPD